MDRNSTPKAIHVRFIIDEADYREPETEEGLIRQERFASMIADAWAQSGTPKTSTFFIPRFPTPDEKESLSVDDVVEHVVECANKAALAGYPTMSLCVEPGGWHNGQETLYVFAQNTDDEDSRVNSIPIEWSGTVEELDDELCWRFCEEGILVQQHPDALEERRVFSMSLVTLDTEDEFCSKIVRLEEGREIEQFGRSRFDTTTRSMRNNRIELAPELK